MAKKINIDVNLRDEEAKKKLKDIQNGKYKVDMDVNVDGINQTTQGMNRLKASASNTNTTFGKLRNTISDTFSTGKLAMTGYLAVLRSINLASKNAKQSIKELDKSVTDLSVATNMSRKSTYDLLGQYNNMAKQLSSTTTHISSAADDYLRAGKSMSEANKLIQDSIMLSKLGQIDSGAATEDLLATMNGFNMSVEEVNKALDSMVAIDMAAATSSGDIATALKYCASSADVAGVSFNKLAAMIGTVQDKTQQSAETVGTFMNTLLSRYRNVKIGQFVDDDGQDLSDVETILDSVGIKLRETNHEFRDFETVIDEVAKSWNNYSGVQQAAIAKAFSGSRQQNRFIALMEGYNKTLELTEVAANSAGTAVEKFNNSYQNSLEAKQNTLQATFESMIMNSDMGNVYGDILDATTALVKFVDETNLLKGALTGLATFGGIKAFMTIKTGAMEAYVELNKFKNAMDIVKSTNISTAQFDKLLLLSEGLSKSQMKQVLSTNSLTMAQKKQLLMVSGLSEEESVAALQAWKMTAANNGLTASTTSASNAFKGLTMMIKANPFMIAVTAITIGVAAWQKYKQSIEDVKDRIDELSDSISTLESEYKSLKETGSEKLTDAEQARLQYLEDRIAREKELKKLEEARYIREKYGNSTVGNYLNEDNQNAKYSDFREKYFDGMSKVDVTSLAYGIDHDEQNVIDIGSKIDEYLESQKKIQLYIDQMNKYDSNRQEYIWADELKTKEENKLEKLIPQLQEEYQNYKEAKYEAETAIDEMTQDLDNPNLTDKDKETIQSWIAQYQDVVKIADYYIGLMRDIPAIPNDTDTNTYHNWYSKLSDDEKELANSDDFKEALEKQKEGLGKAALAANDYDIALQEVKNAQESVANSGDGIGTTSFSDTITELSDLQDDLSDLDEAMANIVSDGNVDLSSLDGLIEAFGKLEEAGKNIDTSTVDEAMKSLSDATSIQSAQQALDTLCTEYIKASGILDDLNESNKNLIATRLQGMGVANAEEMVEARLAAQKYATANGCIDLANATWEEISALIAEGNASQETQQYLANLALSKIDVNNIKLDTKADVDNIIAIANAAGASAAQIAALKTALASLSNANITKWDDANKGGGMGSTNLMNPAKLNTPSSGNSKIDQFAKQQQAQKTKDAVQDATDTLAKTLDDIKNGAYNLDASNFYANYSGGSATSKAVNDAAKAAKDAAKDVKEAVAETFDFIENGINRFDKALSKLEDKVDKTSSSFTSRLNAYKEALNATTFGIELLTDDYNKYMQKANEVGLNEDIASAVRGGASNIWDYSDDTVKQQIKDYQNWYDKAQDCLDKIDELKDKQLELTQASIELLITQYEKLSTKVENANDRMEKWISLKESWGFSANTKNYDSMNKNIQKQIDYINKQDEQLKLLQKTVTKGSEAWYEYNERIDSNKASLIELKQQMQENATAAAVLAKATADKKTEKYDSQDELYDAKIDNATSAKSKNKLIDKKISNINKTQKAYNTAVSTDNKNLKSAKKTISKFKSTSENKKILASIKKVAKSGKRISQSLLNKASKLNDNGKLYNACVQYNAYLDAKEADKATADLYKETAKQDKATLAKEKFDNISSDYENKISSNEQKKTSINNKISLAQEQGKQVSAAYYKSLVSSEKGEKNKLIKERKDLQKSLNDAVIKGSIKKGSDEWYEMVSAINEVTNAIDESTRSIVEFQNALRQLKWDTFDKSLETVKRVNSEADYYIDLMSHKDMTDKDTGNFTEYGIATIGLHKTNYDNYIAQAKAYQDEYSSIMEQIRKGELSTSDESVIQRLRDLQDAHRDAKKSAEDELELIQDLNKQGYEAQTDALSKLIDKFKNLKNNALDYYKYAKSIIEKTKQIAALQKQLIAYNGNDSEESRATIQKLKVQLEESKSDLQDTIYERYLSDTEDMLDDLMNDYQEFIDEKLNDTNSILSNISSLLGDSGNIVATLKSLDTDLTSKLESLITGGTNAVNNNVTNTITTDQNAINTPADTSSYDAAAAAEAAKQIETEKQRQAEIQKFNEQRANLNAQIAETDNQLRQLQAELNAAKAQYNASKAGVKNKDKLRALKDEYTEKTVQIRARMTDLQNNRTVLVNQLNSLPKFAKGSKHINEDGLVLTQEKGAELQYDSKSGTIVTPDGAHLTRVHGGDMIFTNEMSENLWKLAKMNPAQMYAGQFTPVTPDFSKSVNNSSNIEVTFGDLVLPDVTNSAEFADSVESVMREAICKNGKTTQCITEAVSAKQLGKNGVGNARLYK
jgi:phage tail tape measure protein, TP901 family|uniref:Minor tail protein n=1 Tax=Siphoviridae sp. ctDmQ3 TaxID=2823570 RepID=A0A8S5L819_9CAUD|nr:MAG TPA: minor tail protein [Siphoviridae sp. ctDmQ3]